MPIYREKPVATPAQGISDEEKSAARKQANADQRMLGLSGIANLMGFLQDLGEVNAAFRGLVAMDIFDKMRREDPTVAALESATKLPIRGATRQLVPGVKQSEPGYKVAKEIADKCWENLNNLESTTESGSHHTQTLESVIENLLLSPIFGCSGHEDLWAPDADKNQIRLRALQPLLPRTFYQFLPEADGNTLKTLVQFGYRGALVQILPVPAEKICLTTFNREGSYFYGRGMLRPAYMPWKFKRQFCVIDAIGAEKNRVAVPVVKQGPNASERDKVASWTWVANLAANERTGLSLPNGWEFVLAGIEGRAIDLIESIRFYDEQILDAGLAGFLYVGKNSVGARSLGDTKLNYFLMSEEALARMIDDEFSNTTIRRWVDWNYDLKPDQKNLYPRMRTSSICVINVMDIVSSLKDLANSNVDWLQTSDERDNWLAERFGLPLKTTDGRPKYAPIVERIQEMETGSEPIPTQSAEGEPEKAEGGKQKAAGTGAQPGVAVPPGATKPGQTSQTLPSGRVIVPAKQRAAQSATLSESPAPRRELLPHEKKHDFNAHIERQDRTARVVAKILRGAATDLVGAVAKQAAVTPIAQMHTVTASADHQLTARIEKSLGVSHRFGYCQVYAERKRATGRGKNVPVKNLKGVTLSAKPPKHQVRFVAEATISDFNNEVAKRARARAIDLAKEGITGDELASQVSKDVLAAPDGFLDVIGQEASRAALAGGRAAAMEELQPEIAKYVRSEVMDRGTAACAEAGGGCEEGDGQEFDSYDDAPQPPFEDCAGDCRGQLIPVFEDEGAVILE
jgi:hypothetical protein